MDRRWIRIDRAHRAFDCTSTEFETLLSEARDEPVSANVASGKELEDARLFEKAGHLVSSNDDRVEESLRDVATDRYETDNSRFLEAINAELAELAALHRRERFSKIERERSEQEIERTMQGQMLAALHEATLRQDA